MKYFLYDFKHRLFHQHLFWDSLHSKSIVMLLKMSSLFFIYLFLKNLFLFLFCLCWVFVAHTWAVSSCSKQGLLSSCGAHSLQGAGFSSCGSCALKHRFNSCDAPAQLFHGMWDLPVSGIETMSSALPGRLFTTEPPGKHFVVFYKPVVKFLSSNRSQEHCY